MLLVWLGERRLVGDWVLLIWLLDCFLRLWVAYLVTCDVSHHRLGRGFSKLSPACRVWGRTGGLSKGFAPSAGEWRVTDGHELTVVTCCGKSRSRCEPGLALHELLPPPDARDVAVQPGPQDRGPWDHLDEVPRVGLRLRVTQLPF